METCRNQSLHPLYRAANTYRLSLYVPTLLRILWISAFFVCVSPLLPGRDLGFKLELGVCTSLLSLFVLLPIALKATTQNGLLPYPGTPFVILNFVYFVPASLAPFFFSGAYYGTISLKAIPISLLILCIGFLSFAIGVFLSGSVIR